MNRSQRTGIVTSLIVYLFSSFSIVLYMDYAMNRALPTILLSLPIYLVMYIIFFLIKYLIMQTEIIEENLKDITVKKLEKDIVYDELKEAYKRVENLTAMKERNRIAREIHDTVGHTLTTVLVEIEASKRLINKDTGKALDKLNLAQEQVRKGLNDIRSSVRILENGQEIMSFSQSLNAIIEDTKKHSEVAIKTQIEEINLTEEQGKVILSALLEGLTNGIRHGKSTAFLFRLLNKNGHIFFSLSDNGRGTAVLTPGFGLKAMRERVEELGGRLSINTCPEEGLELCIEL
ncbi:sensor histidine kinase [Clostridium sp. 19966]|nr:sensor histidine kinase [Clostridium sp. 19966]